MKNSKTHSKAPKTPKKEVKKKYTAIILVTGLLLYQAIPIVALAQSEAQSDESPVNDASTEQTANESQVNETQPSAQRSETTTPDGANGEENTVVEGDGSDGTSEGVTVIDTGEAVGGTNIENIINTNITKTADVVDESAEDATATSTSSDVASDANTDGVIEENDDENVAIVQQDDTALGTESFDDLSAQLDVTDADNEVTNLSANDASSTPDTVTATSTNTAEVINVSSGSAGTGSNSAMSEGPIVINTGDATAFANVLNVVNTNIFNSTGFLLFLSNLMGNVNTIDLRDRIDQAPRTTTPRITGCDLEACQDNNVEIFIQNKNIVNITNDVVVRSSTGANSASTTGSALINTGNAYATANVVNVANTNITNSNYLLMTFNNFGDWFGDLVLPGMDFFSNIFGQSARPSGNTTAINSNSADIKNIADTVAGTGDNVANTTDTGGLIVTGNASAEASIVNQINTNYFNTSALRILFRVHGNWAGDVFGAPDGVMWRETLSGIELWTDIPFGEGLGASTGATNTTNNSASTTLNNSNIAYIQNNVSVVALTGDNEVTAGGDSLINTGSANASASIINIANTNVVGSNYILAIINIFGDWNGNLAFGRPDLWIGGQATLPSDPVPTGEMVDYIYTITNRGDSPATNATLLLSGGNGIVTFNGYNGEEQELMVNLGTIQHGETRTVKVSGNVGTNIPVGISEVTTNATVSSFETDADTIDNTEKMTIFAFRPTEGSGLSGAHITMTPAPIFNISKTNSATTTLITPGSVDFNIKITNAGGPAYRSVLIDTVKDANGNVINEEKWYLDEIFPDEEINVSYTMIFASSTITGTYTNYAQVKAISGNPSLNPFYGFFANSEIAESSLDVVGINPNLLPNVSQDGLFYGSGSTVKEITNGYVTIKYNNDTATQNDSDKLESLTSLTQVTIGEKTPPLRIINYFGPDKLRAEEMSRLNPIDLVPMAIASNNNDDNNNSNNPNLLLATVFNSIIPSPWLWLVAPLLLGVAIYIGHKSTKIV